MGIEHNGCFWEEHLALQSQQEWGGGEREMQGEMGPEENISNDQQSSWIAVYGDRLKEAGLPIVIIAGKAGASPCLEHAVHMQQL